MNFSFLLLYRDLLIALNNPRHSAYRFDLDDTMPLVVPGMTSNARTSGGKPRILVVLTSHNKLGVTEDAKPVTGWYLPELAHPYYVLKDKYEMIFASPLGGAAPVDKSSVESFKEDKECVEFLEQGKPLYENTQKLGDFLGHSNDYVALFIPGGHGPVFDLTENRECQFLVREFWDADKVVAAVCHAPAVLSQVRMSDGTFFVKGKRMTNFTDEEERLVGLEKAVPFLGETRLKERGAVFSKADKAWGEHVVVDGKLMTGQNPGSARALGEAIDKALSA